MAELTERGKTISNIIGQGQCISDSLVFDYCNNAGVSKFLRVSFQFQIICLVG